MLYYDGINISEGIDLAKNINRKECMICHYWFQIFNHGFKFYAKVHYSQNSLLKMLIIVILFI